MGERKLNAEQLCGGHLFSKTIRTCERRASLAFSFTRVELDVHSFFATWTSAKRLVPYPAETFELLRLSRTPAPLSDFTTLSNYLPK